MLALIPALYLGWGVGANDAANAFGPQVGANLIPYRRAVILAAAFALLGAVAEGEKVFPTLGGVTRLTLEMSLAATLAAGFTVNVMTAFGIPISTSHSIVGALVGVGLAERMGMSTAILLKVAVSMVTAPAGAAVIAYALHRGLAWATAGRLGSTMLFQPAARFTAIGVGCYAAYAMGTNNVANAMAPYVAVGVIGVESATLLGGLAIAAGVLTFSRRVIMAVGKQITALDPISALVASLATALTVHLFTQVGVPVSTSQAIVGSVVGVGLTKGLLAVNPRMLWVIPSAWATSVAGSAAVAYLLMTAYGLVR